MASHVRALIVASALFASSTVAAERVHRPRSALGLSVTAGAGVSRFTSSEVRDALARSECALWELRVTLGSRTRFGVDLSYTGIAATVRAPTTAQTETLVGTASEAVFRVNVLPRESVNPYAFAGLGWQHYDFPGGSITSVRMEQVDGSTVFPVGVGITYRDPGGPLFDVRGTFRATTSQSLMLEDASGSRSAAMHSWTASAGVGYEF